MNKTLLATMAAVAPAIWLSACAAPDISAEQAGHAAISVLNYTDGETIRYSVPLIRGVLTDHSITNVDVLNESSDRPTSTMSFQACNGKFIALADLVPGKNALVVRAGKECLKFSIVYSPQTNPYVTRVIYYTDKTGNTQLFHTANQEQPKDFQGRLATMMLLMQSFTAERMNDLGYGRRTFNLELDPKGDVVVHVLQGSLPMETYHAMDRMTLYHTIQNDIHAQLPNDKAKNVVLPAFSYFDRETKRNLAYTAEGGNDLALFGGANMYCWPRTLAEAQHAFLDATPIDRNLFSDDSAGRHVFWGNTSTTIGAVLHELGHAFDMLHNDNPQGIMNRGFDRFNRLFTVLEPPDARHAEAHEFSDDQIAMWAPGSANILNHHRWLAMDDRQYTAPRTAAMTYDAVSNELVVTSESGVAAISVGTPDWVSGQVPIDYTKPAPKEVRVSVTEYGKIVQKDRSLLQVIDGNGVITYLRLDALQRTAAEGK